MTIAEIRERNSEELTNLSRQLAEDLFKLRVKKATNQLENTSQIRELRRSIAKVQTVISARRHGFEKGKAK